MATTVLEPLRSRPVAPMINPKPVRVCFSYAAYVKNLIHHLYSSKVPVDLGLSDEEVAAVESSFCFTFPADIRSILQEGLPIGPGFPNWRSSSKQQLDVLTNLPILGICKEVSRNGLWFDSWGERPEDMDGALKLAEGFLKNSPFLIPIYRHFYIPSKPCMSGNPNFYVHGGVVRLWSFDIAGFFERVEFSRRPRSYSLFAAPVWAANSARGIEFWTDTAERVKNASARGGWCSGELGGCLKEVWWRLRDGGWKQEDIEEMLMMDGCDQFEHSEMDVDEPLDREGVEWHVRKLSDRLLRGGWSTEDVVESLGFPQDFHLHGEFSFEFIFNVIQEFEKVP